MPDGRRDAPDVAVVGAGIVGLATARALAARGAAVSVYERGIPGNAQSGGESRVFRHAHDDGRLIAAARDSRAIWDAWSRELDRQLVAPGGAITIGPKVDEKLAALRGTDGVDARAIDAAELEDRLPFLAPYDGPAFVDPRGGAIRTTAAIDGLVGTLDGRLVADEVLQVRAVADGRAEVRAGGGTVRHDHVVVCAGRGTPVLARGVGLDLPVRQSTHVRLTFAVRGDAPGTVACLQDGSDAFGETGVYAAPTPGNRGYAVGLSETAGVREDGTIVDADALRSLAARAARYVDRALPGLDPRPIDVRHCWVTELPWGSDGLAAWTTPGLTFLAGHNLFKLAPWLGRLLADRALGADLDARLDPAARLGAPVPAGARVG